MIQIDYVKNVRSRCERLSKDLFIGLINSAEVKRWIDYARLDEDGALERAKGELPGICWQATFKEGRRTDANAQPNGLCALDIDHIRQMGLPGISTPEELWLSFRERVDELDIVCVHKTPSGDGLRVVFLCQPQFMSLAQNQAWMAGEIGCQYDAVCKDWARLYFISVAEEFYYVDWETLF